MNQTVINRVFPALLPEVANELTTHKSLDIFDCMGGVNLTHPELIADGCHPNAAGECGTGWGRATCFLRRHVRSAPQNSRVSQATRSSLSASRLRWDYNGGVGAAAGEASNYGQWGVARWRVSTSNRRGRPFPIQPPINCAHDVL